VNLRPLHFKTALLGYHDWPLLSSIHNGSIITA
jgi:hypothetical protein